MNLTSPATTTPWNWNPQVRFLLATGASALLGVAHAVIGGAPWQTAAVASLGSLVAAVLAHFTSPAAAQKVSEVAVKTVAVLLVGSSLAGLLTYETGCFTPAQSATATQDVNSAFTFAETMCIAGATVAPLLDPSLPPATAASVKAACPAIGNIANNLIDQAIQLFTQQPQLAAKFAAATKAAHARGQW
jgi:hypothetical protein